MSGKSSEQEPPYVMPIERQLRGVARGRVTKIVAELRTLLDDPNVTAFQLKLGLAKLDRAEQILQTENAKCMRFITEQNITGEFNTIDDYDNTIIEVRFAINEKISMMSTGDNSIVRKLEESLNNVNLNHRDTSVVKLPKIEMIKFNGEITNWPSFWDQFSSLVHRNEQLSAISKFSYLKNLLTGKAADVIKGLSPSGDSYTEAINILKNEFSSKNRIVEGYVQKLMLLNKIKDRRDIKAMRDLYNVVLTTTRTFDTLKVDPNAYELVVKNTLSRCLPSDVMVDFHRFQSGQIATNEESEEDNEQDTNHKDGSLELLKFLRIEVDSLERGRMGTFQEKNDHFAKKQNFGKKEFNKNKGTATGLLVSTSDSCIFCDAKEHNLFNCKSNLSLSDRKSILAKNKRCFRCMKSNHFAKECRTKNLQCSNCKGRHLSQMCDPNWKPVKTENLEGKEAKDVSLLSGNNRNEILLQTARVNVSDSDNNCFSLKVIIDGGSQLSFVTESVSRKLKLPIIGQQKVSLNTFGSKISNPAKPRNRVSIKLCSKFDSKYVVIEAIEVPDICADILPSPKAVPLNAKYKLADKVDEVADIEGISVLIGANYYWRVVTDDQERISDDMMAINTIFGWTIHGQFQENQDTSINKVALLINAVDIDVEHNELRIDNFWSLESIGIMDKVIPDKTNEDFVKDYIENKVVIRSNRVEVSIPWKSSEPSIFDNYGNAIVSLKLLMLKLKKDREKLIEYHNSIMEYVKNGWAERVSAPECSTIKPIYYMPHRAVYRDNSETTKVRIVFNASSRAKNSGSLNDVVHSGPNLNPELLKVLLNFRIGRFAVVSDIEKAFLQVGLNKDDRDSHRFIWYDDISFSKLTEFRMTCVTFGVTCSPFLLAAALRKIVIQENLLNSSLGTIILESFYVDDFIYSCDDLQGLRNLVGRLIKVTSKYSMHLRKWDTNTDELEIDCVTSSCSDRKVLGLIWNVVRDSLSIDISAPMNYLLEMESITKRSVLYFISRIFDPLGIFDERSEYSTGEKKQFLYGLLLSTAVT